MFIKSVILSRNHWSYRLLQWMFPSLNRFYNFCPHFWLTLVALVLSPFKLILTILVYPLKSFDNWMNDMLDTKARNDLDKLSDEDLKLLYAYKRERYWLDLPKCTDKKYSKMYSNLNRIGNYERWQKLNMELLFDRMDSLVDLLRMEGYKEEENSPPPPPIRTRPWWPRVVVIAKYASSLLLIPLGWLVYNMIFWIGYLWYYIVRWDWLNILGALAFIIVLVGTIVLVGWLLSKIPARTFNFPRCIVCKKIGYGLLAVLTGIGFVFIFFWEGIKAFKSSNCPEIKWKD